MYKTLVLCAIIAVVSADWMTQQECNSDTEVLPKGTAYNGNCIPNGGGRFVSISCTGETAVHVYCSDRLCQSCFKSTPVQLNKCDMDNRAYYRCYETIPDYSKIIGSSYALFASYADVNCTSQITYANFSPLNQCVTDLIGRASDNVVTDNGFVYSAHYDESNDCSGEYRGATFKVGTCNDGVYPECVEK